MTKKTLIAITAVVLVLFCTVGATLAWLVATTGEVKNTFTYGDIDITLTETFNKDLNNDGSNDTWEGKMVPGNELSKDPKVTVKGGSEDCWLFVKVTKANNPDAYLTYSIATGWTQLTDGSGNVISDFYYREVSSSAADQSFSVLTDDKVTVKNNVTKANLTAITKNPTLTFQAYAVQKDNVATAYAAWQIANSTT